MRYDCELIVGRRKLPLPGGKTLAFSVGKHTDHIADHFKSTLVATA